MTRILIIDDDPAVIDFCKIVLRSLFSLEVEIIVAQDGHQGLAAVDEHDGQIDLIITDQMMPKITGSELAVIIQERGLEIPILMITGGHEPELPDNTLICAVIRKPIELDELVQAIFDYAPVLAA